MKKTLLISLLMLTILSCSSDDSSDSNSLNGRWYFKQVTNITITGESIISGTGTLTDCKSHSYYEIHNGDVMLKEFQSCEIFNEYIGNYDSTTNQLLIADSNSTATTFNIEISGNQLKLESSNTIMVDNVPTTYKVIQYCEK